MGGQSFPHRYGPVTKRQEISSSEWRGIYVFKEYRVEVMFSNNVSMAEIIQPIVKRSFSSDEKKALIETVGGMGEWRTLFGDVWVNNDTKARAQIDIGSGRQILTVMTKEYFDSRKRQ